jgi:hypothetical protein
MRFQRTSTHIRKTLGDLPNAHQRKSPAKTGLSYGQGRN